MAEQTSTLAWQEAIAVADRGLEIRNATLERLLAAAGLDAPGGHWDVDMRANQFRWEGSKGVVVCPVQILGTRNPHDDTWLWGWDHDEIDPTQRTAAETVRAWGQERGLLPLTTAKVHCVPDQAKMFGNVAIGLGAGDFVFIGGDSPEVYLVLADEQIHPA
jgi:hypothetical protein